jgi:hypothetical protein
MDKTLSTIVSLRRQLGLVRAALTEALEARNFALTSWKRAVTRAAKLSDELQRTKGREPTKVYPALDRTKTEPNMDLEEHW